MWALPTLQLYSCRQLHLTWKRLMSRGFPAFFRQFWLHFRKNLRKNLHRQRKRGGKGDKWDCDRAKYSMSYFDKTQNTNKTYKTAEADKPHTLSLAHPSEVYDKGSFLCKNSSGILSKMLPCISISELLSQLAINSPRQTWFPPLHSTPPLAAEWRRLCCSYYAAQCCHSCLSQSQCERPHQQHLPCIINRLRWQVWLPTSILNEGGREEGGSEE